MRPDGEVTGGPAVNLPMAFGRFTARAWVDRDNGVEHLSLTRPSLDGGAPLVRLHSECLTGDVFGSYRCDCGEQLDYALKLMARDGGTLVYLRGHEGRGIGLANKMRAYSLQETGADTVEANERLGLPIDARTYGSAAEILRALGLSSVRLLTNNPAKSWALEAHGIHVETLVSSEVPPRPENERYLVTKQERMGHALALRTVALV